MSGSGVIKQDLLPVLLISRFIRRMKKGGSQAHLVEACDERYYIAKFLGSPQGSRLLINELICGALLSALEVSSPSFCLLYLAESTELNHATHISNCDQRVIVPDGPHLGSLLPVNPDQVAIFDFLPKKLLHLIGNIEEFASIFAFDRWVNNIGTRHAIFFRDRALAGGSNFRASFVDHETTLAESGWHLGDNPHYGLVFPKSIYALIDMQSLSAHAVDRIEALSHEKIISAAECVPPGWLNPGDRKSLLNLLGQLDESRVHLRSLVRTHLQALQSHW